jgi:hypothetical protein
MSKKSIEEPVEAQMNEAPMNEDEYINLDNIEALNEALKPKRTFYPITLHNGQKLKIPVLVLGMAHGMEASDGEHYKKDEPNNSKKVRRVWIRKMNSGILEGWKIVNDKDFNLVQKGETRTDSHVRLLRDKKIPITIFSMIDYNGLTETMFPGSMDDPQDVRDRLDAIHNGSGESVSNPGPSDDGGEALLPETV